VRFDIDLPLRTDVMDVKTIGSEPILYQPDLLSADQFLPPVANDEGCRWRPDMSNVTPGEVTALMDVAAGDETQIDGAQ
jgi:hypothetical protein